MSKKIPNILIEFVYLSQLNSIHPNQPSCIFLTTIIFVLEFFGRSYGNYIVVSSSFYQVSYCNLYNKLTIHIFQCIFEGFVCASNNMVLRVICD